MGPVPGFTWHQVPGGTITGAIRSYGTAAQVHWPEGPGGTVSQVIIININDNNNVIIINNIYNIIIVNNNETIKINKNNTTTININKNKFTALPAPTTSTSCVAAAAA